MKTLNPFKLICWLFIPLILQSCSNEIGAWKNEKIAQGNRDELNRLNAQVFKHLKNVDTKGLEAYLSKELLEDAYTARIAERISNRLNADSFINFNNYYVVNNYVGADTINNTNLGVNNFRLVYPGTAQEMYISMFVPKNKATPNKSMITLVYANYPYGWKLSKLDIGAYTKNGKTSPELCALARQQYNKGRLFAAANTVALATSCSRPNHIWQYLNEEELYDFDHAVTNEVNIRYRYPIVLASVSTKPKVLGVYNTTSDEGSYPTLQYLTKINIKDADAIKKENDEIKKTIGTVLPGVDQDVKYILYAAYNEMPSGDRSVPHYEIKDILK